uniref:Uncharacterized protein n=1 Tax=Oryza brachyantha TaxID=4533 RepID=J3LQE1_ORYBR
MSKTTPRTRVKLTLSFMNNPQGDYGKHGSNTSSYSSPLRSIFLLHVLIHAHMAEIYVGEGVAQEREKTKQWRLEGKGESVFSPLGFRWGKVCYVYWSSVQDSSAHL